MINLINNEETDTSEEAKVTIAGEVFDIAMDNRMISVTRENSPLSNFFGITVKDDTSYFNQSGEKITFENIEKGDLIFSVGKGDENNLTSDRIILVKENLEIFSETGNISINAPGSEPGIVYLVYEKPGAPANSTILKMTDFSICDMSQDNKSCSNFRNNPNFYIGERVSVYGTKEGDLVNIIYIKSVSD